MSLLITLISCFFVSVLQTASISIAQPETMPEYIKKPIRIKINKKREKYIIVNKRKYILKTKLLGATILIVLVLV